MKKFIPIIIFIFSIYLRFSRLSELMYFMIDEDRYSFIMKRIFVDHKLILAGVTIPGGIYLGPAYFYVSGMFQFLFNFDPMLMGALASAIGVLSVIGIFWLGKKFFGFNAGIIAAIFYAISYTIVIYNRIYWTLTWSSLAALTTYWGIYQIITKKKYGYIFLMTGWFILGSQSDASYFSLIVLSVILLWRQLQNPAFKKASLISASLLIIAQFPLVAFDLRHGFHNVKLIINRLNTPAFSDGPSIKNTLKALMVFPNTLSELLVIYPPYDITYRLSPAESAKALRESNQSFPAIFLSTIILIFFLLIRVNGTAGLPIKIIKAHFLIAMIGVVFYSLVFPGYVHSWFVTILFPAIALVIGYLLHLLVKKGQKNLVIMVMLLFSVFHLRVLMQSTNSFGFKYKQQAVKYAITQVQGKKFFLNSLGSQAYGGYRYLFWLYGSEPIRSYMDNFYSGWIYDQPNQAATAIGVIMVNISPYEPESVASMLEINQARSQAVNRQTFGGIEVLIIPSP